MLADTLTLFGAAVFAALGTTLVLMVALHGYASWTIRNIDRDVAQKERPAGPFSHSHPMEPTGLEPVTYALPARRSPS